MITNFTSIKTVFSKIYRDLGVNYEIDEVSMIEWIGEAMDKIGAYAQYEEKSSCLTLVDGKVKLPIGFNKLIDISYKGFPMYWSSNKAASNYQCENCTIGCADSNVLGQHTFYINDCYIVTNISESNNSDPSICIVYSSVRLDDEGFPLIPDDEHYKEALASYVIHKVDYQEWRKGKVTDKVYQASEANWLFYCKAANGVANMPTTAQLENLKNVLRRIMPLTNDYNKHFKNITRQEKFTSR